MQESCLKTSTLHRHVPVLSLTPLSTSMRSRPHNVRVASSCMTSAWMPADSESVFSRFTVLVRSMAVGWAPSLSPSPSDRRAQQQWSGRNKAKKKKQTLEKNFRHFSFRRQKSNHILGQIKRFPEGDLENLECKAIHGKCNKYKSIYNLY